MRYRPFGRSGLALSTLGLHLSREKLHKNHSLLQKLITAALENGINTYHFESNDPKMLQAAAEVFSVVERKLLFVSVGAQEPALNADPAAYALPALKERLRGAIKDTGLSWLDLLVFSEDGVALLPEDSLHFVKSLQRSKMLRYVAAEAEPASMPAIIKSGHFDVIKTTFDIDSSWDKRRQIDNAISREMNVMASGFFPRSLSQGLGHHSAGSAARLVRRQASEPPGRRRHARLPAPDRRLDARGVVPGLCPVTAEPGVHHRRPEQLRPSRSPGQCAGTPPAARRCRPRSRWRASTTARPRARRVNLSRPLDLPDARAYMRRVNRFQESRRGPGRARLHRHHHQGPRRRALHEGHARTAAVRFFRPGGAGA
ncbi:MAG: hypothetical protein WDN06_20295 [Asticcacaulis sp.]